MSLKFHVIRYHIVNFCCFQARERDATTYEKRIGKEMSESLRELIKPHFLRRTKAMVLENNKAKTDVVDGSEESEKENRQEDTERCELSYFY